MAQECISAEFILFIHKKDMMSIDVFLVNTPVEDILYSIFLNCSNYQFMV